MDFSETQIKEAQSFGQFYIDLIENYNSTVRYYLSDQIVLDWFGQTVKGDKKVNVFLSSNVASVKHFFADASPAEKIGFRDTHVIKLPKEQKKMVATLMSPPRSGYSLRTPTKRTLPSTSTTPKRERAQRRCQDTSPSSPAKKFKSDWPVIEQIESESDLMTVKYIKTEGSVEFHRPSMKKLQAETKWKRPCKLSVAYTCTNDKDYIIHLIIYEGNVKCRRNLLQEFSATESEN